MMNRICVCVLMIGIGATAADATILRMNFPGGSNTATIVQGGSVDVEIWVDLFPGDEVSAIGFGLNAIPGDPVIQTAVSAAFGMGGSHGGWGEPLGSSLSYWSANYGPDNLSTPGASMIGTMTVSSNVVGTHDLTFDDMSVMFLDAGGNVYSFSQTWGMQYPGWLAYGDYGSLGVHTANKSDVPYNPLFLNVVPIPEPTTLVVLALGGFVVLRRRR